MRFGNIRFPNLMAIAAIFAGTLAALPALAKTHRPSYSAVAKPQRDVVLAFSRPGVVASMAAGLGSAVRAGQLLAALNSARQNLSMQIARLAADSSLKVQAAKAQLRHDEVDLQQTQWAFTQKAATAFELQRARLKVTIARLSLALADLKHKNDLLQYRLAQLAVRRRQIDAPFAGIVEVRYAHRGESVNAFQKILRLVQINALKIRVPVPLPMAVKLHTGQRAIIHFATGGKAVGNITGIASVADAASGTLLVRVHVPNPNKLPAGQEVQVHFLAAPSKLPLHPAIHPRGPATGTDIGRRKATPPVSSAYSAGPHP